MKKYAIPDQTHEAVVLELQDLTNQCEQLRATVTELKDQIKATNVELVAVRVEVSNLKLEAKDLRNWIEILKIQLAAVADASKEAMKPFNRVAAIVGGSVIIAVLTAIYALIFK
jgi:predicted  nucleic acid-binding Zn-ribbon protein